MSILVLILLSNSRPINTAFVEFDSMTSCLSALNKVLEMESSALKIKARCVQK